MRFSSKEEAQDAMDELELNKSLVYEIWLEEVPVALLPCPTRGSKDAHQRKYRGTAGTQR